MKDRFAKLTSLTRGAALVGLGIGAAAGCTTESPAQPPPVTGATAPAAAPADPAPPSSPPPLVRRKFPMPNALHPVDGPGAAPSDAGAPGSTPGTP